MRKAAQDLPDAICRKSSVYLRFRRWTLAGLWEQIMDAVSPPVTTRLRRASSAS
ncbi:hypothetical protein CDZ95_19270 [Mameliella alba]|nr:hypothetical protein CDZ95_19270 [Mameliella alba]